MSQSIYLNALLGKMLLFKPVDSLSGSLMNFLDKSHVVPFDGPNFIPVDLVVDDIFGHSFVPVVEVNGDVAVKLRVQEMMSILIDLWKAYHWIYHLYFVLQITNLDLQITNVLL